LKELGKEKGSFFARARQTEGIERGKKEKQARKQMYRKTGGARFADPKGIR
jgi:hypothetical protein